MPTTGISSITENAMKDIKGDDRPRSKGGFLIPNHEAARWAFHWDKCEYGGFQGEFHSMGIWGLLIRSVRRPRRGVVCLLMHCAERRPQSLRYTNDVLEKIKRGLSRFYSKDIETIVCKIKLCVGSFEDAEPYKFTPDKPRHYKQYEFFMVRTWINFYPKLINVEDPESGLLLREHVSDTLSAIWDQVCLKESRATISRDTFTYLIEGLMNFSEDLKRKYNKNNWERLLPAFRNPDPDFIALYRTNPERWRANQIKDEDTFLSFRALDFRDFFNSKIRTLPRKSCLEEFLLVSYWSLAADLIKEQKLILCQNEKCKRLAGYYKGKKYCSLDKDGRNCLQRVAKRRSYQKKSSGGVRK